MYNEIQLTKHKMDFKNRKIKNYPPSPVINSNYKYWIQDALSSEVKPILRSDEEKELVWCRREEQRKQVVKNFDETFVKNAFQLLCIRV